MTAKEYLGQIRLADIKIRQLQERLESMKSIGGAMQYDKIQVQSSPSNATEDRLISIIDLEEEIRSRIVSNEAIKTKIAFEIQALSDTRYIDALYYRYVLCMRAEEIAVTMNYEYGALRKILVQARASFAEKYGLDQEMGGDIWAFTGSD